MNIGALIVWLLALASGAAVFILTPDVWTLALAAGIVLVPLAGMAGAFAARKAVAVEVILPRGAEKGRDAVIAFRGTNGAWLPLPRVEFRFVMTNGLTGETRRETVRLSLPGRGTGETAVTLHSGQCGLFRIQAECVRVCDPLGICRFTAADDRHWELMVQPGLFAMELLLPMRGSVSEDSARYAQDRAGYDLAETFQVREYAPGDSPRQIHWKLSSKLDELILKEASQPESRSLLVFWDKRTGGNPQQMDALAEVVSSAGMALLQSGVPYTLCWTDRDDLQVQDISEENQLLQAIPALVKTRGSAECRLPKTDGYSRILCFGTTPEEQLLTDGRVHFVLCTEEQYPGATTFAPQNYSEAMQRLEV